MTRLAAVAALLALLLAACEEGRPAAAPPAPTTVPWWQDGVLHVAGAEIPTPLREIVYAGGTTLVGAADAEASRWSLVRDGRLAPLVRARTRVDPVLSDDGSRIAWVRDTHSRQVAEQVYVVMSRVVAYDVATGRRAGPWSTHHRVQCCDAVGQLFVEEVVGDGSVVLARAYLGRMRWVPGADPVPLPGRGTWPGSRDGLTSPDGGAVALLATDDGSRPPKEPRTVPWVRGHGRPVRLDAQAGARIVAWEDDAHVVLASGHPVRFLRCTAATGACEQTADRPAAGRVWFPAYR